MSTAKFERNKREYLHMSVYRDADGSDHTAGGISRYAHEIIVYVGDGTPAEFFEDCHGKKHPVFVINKRGGAYNVRPVAEKAFYHGRYTDEPMAGPMFGGNYATGKYTPEFKHLPDMVMIHDRYETWEAYDMLSR